MADAGRCLSDLSDDLLRHILSFAPASARAATSVLSRRWLRLWRSSGDVYLDSRSFVGGCSSAEQESEAFLHGAEKVLAATAAFGPIKRLTISIAEDSKIILLKQSWSWSGSDWEQKLTVEHNLIEALVSNPAARRVEELQIEVKPLNTQSMLSFVSLPSQTLRVLRITRCQPLMAALPPGAVFPMLVDLHLQGCGVPVVDLQSIIDAAPRLSTLHLAPCYFNTETNFTNEVVVGRLLMPAVSTLVLADCTYGHRNNHRLELDVPSLQYFRYQGPVKDTNCLSLKSQASTIHVDLHLNRGRNGYDYGDINGQTPPVSELFWRFIQNFNTTKHLKVRIDDYFTMHNLALIDEVSRDELLGGLSFSLMEQLELEAEYEPRGTSMVMLADLLHSSPMVHDIRIKLTRRHEYIRRESSKDKEARVHLDRSVNAFRNRRRRQSMVSLAPQNDDNYDSLDIPGLTGEHSFSCLQSHVKRVSLQFFRDEPNCLGVQLAMFFAQNAMVLQELHIDDGCQEMLEHLNFSFQRWIANTNNANNKLIVKD